LKPLENLSNNGNIGDGPLAKNMKATLGTLSRDGLPCMDGIEEAVHRVLHQLLKELREKNNFETKSSR
jgi:hypothetical protein